MRGKVFCAGHDGFPYDSGRSRMLVSRGGRCRILRMVAAILVCPARRISPMVRLRTVSTMRDMEPVRTLE